MKIILCAVIGAAAVGALAQAQPAQLPTEIQKTLAYVKIDRVDVISTLSKAKTRELKLYAVYGDYEQKEKGSSYILVLNEDGKLKKIFDDMFLINVQESTALKKIPLSSDDLNYLLADFCKYLRGHAKDKEIDRLKMYIEGEASLVESPESKWLQKNCKS